MPISIEDGLCCPDCSTMECLIVLPEDTTSCPSCGGKAFLNSAEMMAKIHQLHRAAIEAAGIKITDGLRPEGLRPEGLRPEGLRPEGLRPKEPK